MEDKQVKICSLRDWGRIHACSAFLSFGLTVWIGAANTSISTEWFVVNLQWMDFFSVGLLNHTDHICTCSISFVTTDMLFFIGSPAWEMFIINVFTYSFPRATKGSLENWLGDRIHTFSQGGFHLFLSFLLKKTFEVEYYRNYWDLLACTE